jgi:hypothetical protein
LDRYVPQSKDSLRDFEDSLIKGSSKLYNRYDYDDEFFNLKKKKHFNKVIPSVFTIVDRETIRFKPIIMIKKDILIIFKKNSDGRKKKDLLIDFIPLKRFQRKSQDLNLNLELNLDLDQVLNQ